MILVTGSSGVLGRALGEQLAGQAEPYHLMTSAEVDLCDTAATVACFARHAPRLVYHLAGRVHGLMGNRSYPAEMYVENVRINTNVVEAARLAGCEKIVAVSTVAIYNSDVPMPVQETSIWNGPPHHSEAAYGHAKRAMLAQLEAASSQYGLQFAYPIMTNIYGPHDRFDMVNGHVVPSLIAKFHAAAQSGGEVTVWGTGVAERDFMMSTDAARALVLVAERHSGPINVATGTTVRIRDLVDSLGRHAKVDAIAWDSTKPDGQVMRRYDVSKLFGLGFRPEVGLAEGVARTYDWYSAAFPGVRS